MHFAGATEKHRPNLMAAVIAEDEQKRGGASHLESCLRVHICTFKLDKIKVVITPGDVIGCNYFCTSCSI